MSVWKAALIGLISVGVACDDVQQHSAASSAGARAQPPAVGSGQRDEEHDDHGDHAAADWCLGHGLPESKCTKCNPELVEKFKQANDWCEEHGFPESACPKCNPQPEPSAQPIVDWCLEHALPESKCTKCNPSLVAEYRQARDYCDEHGFPESACPLCNPQPAPPGAEEAALEARVVRFRSADIEQAAGVKTVAATRSTTAPEVRATARIAFDENRLADVRALVPGVVRSVRVDLGAVVKPGEALFRLESTRVGEIQGALEAARKRVGTARRYLERQRRLQSSGLANANDIELAEQRLADAKADARTAAASLRMAGAPRSKPSGGYTLHAPIAGTVVRRPAVIGLLATEQQSLATVADTSVMWVLCEVPETSAGGLEPGLPVRVEVAGTATVLDGKLTWVSAEVSPRTRTVAVRAEVKNPKGQLRHNQFATARIQVGAPRGAVSVPRAAVQRVGDRELVFVRRQAGVYEPRVVRRQGDGDPVYVQGRVRPGDAVVTAGAVLLRTEILPGSIGAGCCEVEPGGH